MTVPQPIVDLIRLREGVKSRVYRDTKEFVTGGVGHKLSAAERAAHPVGSLLSKDLVQAWQDHDTLVAYNLGIAQAKIIGGDNASIANDPRLIAGLTSVCFQMGAAWHLPEAQGGKGFTDTWQMLLDHKWEAAAANLVHSLWFKQSPIRVEDFQAALRSLVSA